MKAKIYKPSKTAMQSGRSKFNKWVLKFNNNRNQKKDSLMGWNGGSNTISQVELKFDTVSETKLFKSLVVLVVSLELYFTVVLCVIKVVSGSAN